MDRSLAANFIGGNPSHQPFLQQKIIIVPSYGTPNAAGIKLGPLCNFFRIALVQYVNADGTPATVNPYTDEATAEFGIDDKDFAEVFMTTKFRAAPGSYFKTVEFRNTNATYGKKYVVYFGVDGDTEDNRLQARAVIDINEQSTGGAPVPASGGSDVNIASIGGATQSGNTLSFDTSGLATESTLSALNGKITVGTGIASAGILVTLASGGIDAPVTVQDLPDSVKVATSAVTPQAVARSAGSVVGVSGGSAIQSFAVESQRGGIVEALQLIINATSVPSGMGNFRLWLFKDAPTAIADNAAFTLSVGDQDKLSGWIDLPLPALNAGTASFLSSQVTLVDLPFIPVASTLYGILQTLGGYTSTAVQYRLNVKYKRGQ